jgi:hypothetical protein
MTKVLSLGRTEQIPLTATVMQTLLDHGPPPLQQTLPVSNPGLAMLLPLLDVQYCGPPNCNQR